MCVQEENRIEGLCSCLCTDIDDSERELIATWVRHFKKGIVDSCAVFTGRELFVLCEFFARRGRELWPWGWHQRRPERGHECVRSVDCLDRFGRGESAFLKKWISIYMHEFFEPEESLPELERLFGLRPPRLQMLLNFFVHHGGCLTDKFMCDN
jgi:hypothetical protein